MKCSLKIYQGTGVDVTLGDAPANDHESQLVICMGSKTSLANKPLLDTIRQTFPKAHVAFCSTSGEIYNNEVVDNSIVATVLEFEHTTIRTAMVNISSFETSKAAAIALTKLLPSDGLRYVMAFSDGGKVNGSEWTTDTTWNNDLFWQRTRGQRRRPP
ncbi:MAG: FIST N-terminal domain-containing protein, partial [Bacteroidota bacterium]